MSVHEVSPRSILLLIEHLTPREGEVLDELAKGRTNAQIAVTLVVADTTVRTHLSNIYSKLNVHSRTEALLAAQELGLVTTGGQLSPEASTIVVLAKLRPGALAEAANALAGEGYR